MPCRLVTLLFAIQASPDEALKCAAADVLTEIISKRMEAEAKLQLIQQLNMGHTFAQWAGALPVQPDEQDLAGKYAKLLAAIATGKLPFLKRSALRLGSQAPTVAVAIREHFLFSAGSKVYLVTMPHWAQALLPCATASSAAPQIACCCRGRLVQ